MQSLIDTGATVKALNAMYDKGIEHAIETIKEELMEVEKHSPADSILRIIIIKLRNLQSNSEDHENNTH